jgi:serine protease 7 (enterokinase)
VYRTSENDPHLQTHSVKAIVKHPDFTTYYLGSDLAILVLTKTVEFNEYIRPVCLPEVDQVVPLSSICYSTGFGMTDGNDGITTPKRYQLIDDFVTESSLPEALQEAKMKLYSDAQCKKSYFFVNDDFQCAGYESGYISNCQVCVYL